STFARPESVVVVLSEAKDLIAACHRHEILRCAQDDRYSEHWLALLPVKRNGSAGLRSRSPSSASASFHRTLLVVGVLGILHRRGYSLHRHHALGILHRFLDVEVLDRVVVGVVLEAAAQRLEVGF